MGRGDELMESEMALGLDDMAKLLSDWTDLILRKALNPKSADLWVVSYTKRAKSDVQAVPSGWPGRFFEVLRRVLPLWKYWMIQVFAEKRLEFTSFFRENNLKSAFPYILSRTREAIPSAAAIYCLTDSFSLDADRINLIPLRHM